MLETRQEILALMDDFRKRSNNLVGRPESVGNRGALPPLRGRAVGAVERCLPCEAERSATVERCLPCEAERSATVERRLPCEAERSEPWSAASLARPW